VLRRIVAYYRERVFGPVFWDRVVARLKILVGAFGVSVPKYQECPLYTPDFFVPYIQDINQVWLFKLDEHLRRNSGLGLAEDVVGGENLQAQIEMVLQVQHNPA